MTTELTAAAAEDQAARLEALRQRRNPAPAASTATPAGGPTRHRRRRRHAATGARIMVGALSAATTVALVGVMTGTSTDAVDPSPTSEAVGAPSPPTDQSLGHQQPGRAPVVAPHVRASAAAPITESTAS
jgi:hypothetical protein